MGVTLDSEQMVMMMFDASRLASSGCMVRPCAFMRRMASCAMATAPSTTILRASNIASACWRTNI